MKPNPRRGEIWRVQFEPSIGAETRKVRPALVLSRDDVGALPLRVVVPLTIFQKHFANVAWLIEIEANQENGLAHKSVADCFQPRSFALERFINRQGSLKTEQVNRIARTVAEALGVIFEET